ncbi:unnamed protein product [Miscanthus lutarioriparius]|uniref:Uncharacterized protein n=1 Tax=Miscanthus lutarioriparius TaxID=422564 RepID=A0A811NDE5_9POAL|nr:unnamed protein product [Miscanthus lutarioriparius]
MVGLKLSMAEVDRGFVTLVASDHSGFEVCNPNGHWYLADAGSCPDVLLLSTGRALSCYCWSTAKFSAKSAMTRDKYPDRIPVIVEKAGRTDVPKIDEK